jgi:hypothetical protein
MQIVDGRFVRQFINTHRRLAVLGTFMMSIVWEI